MTKARDLGDFISDGTIAETVTADGLDLGDNERIRLGDSQDLQIYHDGNTSRIDELGTGNLDIRANDFRLMAPDDTVIIYSDPDDNNSIGLYHQGNLKIKTASTGVNVTGTVAVSGSFNATSGTFTVQDNGTDILNVTSTEMTPQTDGAISLGSATNGFNNMYLDGSAYVSGNVGVGTNSPARKLQVESDGNRVVSVKHTDGSSAFVTFSDNATTDDGQVRIGAVGNDLVGLASSVEGMRLTSTGLGIGTSSPARKLQVESTDSNRVVSVKHTAGAYAYVTFSDNTTTDDGTVRVGALGNDLLNFVGGAERLRITSNGELGIGGANYGTAGQVLTSGGSGAAPTWADAGGGGSLEFTATGTISAGNVVGLTSSGEVKVISAYKGSETNVSSSGTIAQWITAAYDSNSNKVVVIWTQASSSDYPYAAVGTVSGTTITFGTPAQVIAEDSYKGTVCFNPSNNTIAYLYTRPNASYSAKIIAGVISGNTISWGIRYQVTANNTYSLGMVYDPDTSQFVIVYAFNGNELRGRTVSYSGTNPTFGTDTQLVSGQSQVEWDPNNRLVYDTTANKVIVSWRNGSNNGSFNSITVSGSSISASSTTATSFSWDNRRAATGAYDSNSNRTLGFYYDGSDLKFVVTDNTGSAPSVSAATGSYIAGSQNHNEISFTDTSGNFVVTTEQVSGGYGMMHVGNFDGSNVLLAPPIQLSPAERGLGWVTHAYDTSNNKLVMAYANDNNSGLESVVGDPSAATIFGNYIGVAEENIANGATGKVSVLGGLNETLTGLSPSYKYYLQDDGTIDTVGEENREIGRALSSTSILLTKGSVSF